MTVAHHSTRCCEPYFGAKILAPHPTLTSDAALYSYQSASVCEARDWTARILHLWGRSARGVSFMSYDEDDIGARSPSGWHDDAAGRDAGHDAMQVAVYDYLQTLPENEPSPFFESHGMIRIGVYFEYPFYRRERIISWGDVVEFWVEANPPPERYAKKKYMIWEIKPRIYSVGAVVRQCVAVRHAAEASLDAEARLSRRAAATVEACPVVMHNDPKLGMLQHVYAAAAWNGREFV